MVGLCNARPGRHRHRIRRARHKVLVVQSEGSKGAGEERLIMASVNKLLGRAFEAYHAGRIDEAEAICRKLVALAPREGRVCFLLGMSLRRAGRGAEAADWLNRAARLQPRSPEVLNGLGSAYSDLQDYPRAAECFARAIEINPRYAVAHYNMGNACQRLRQYDRALVFYQS